jgi:V/A-type H+-transporting ATPase subunit E
MGTGELLAALRSEGERKAGVIREEAEAEAARLKGEVAATLSLLRQRYAQEQARAAEAEEGAILAEAYRAARRIRLAAAERLAERLFKLALALLPHLRSGEYPALFAHLATELPPCEWETVRVNPADVEQAAALFARPRIVPDPSISGGLEALAEGGKMQVVNTLEKRLERGWPELIPLLLKEVENDA